MKDQLKPLVKPYGMLFAIALAVAVVGRVGLAVLDGVGGLSYDYISASNVAVLDTICSILTGSAFVAFLFAAGLVLSLSAAGVALFGLLFAQGKVKAHPLAAFLSGWATAFAAIVCLIVVASGILSSVQVGSMSSKLPGTGVIIVGLVGFAAIIGTLLGAASMTVSACLARGWGHARYGWNLAIAALCCGLVVMVLTVGTFCSINQVEIAKVQVAGWFAADVVVNVAMMAIAGRLVRRAAANR